MSSSDFREFQQIWQPRIAAEIYAFTGDRGAAGEIAQEVFSLAGSRWTRLERQEDPVRWSRQEAWQRVDERWLGTSRPGGDESAPAMVAALAELPRPPAGPWCCCWPRCPRTSTSRSARPRSPPRSGTRRWNTWPPHCPGTIRPPCSHSCAPAGRSRCRVRAWTLSRRNGRARTLSPRRAAHAVRAPWWPSGRWPCWWQGSSA
ncbi:hypothetical protein ACFQZ4_28730 [Catellatospora coxensis]